MDKKNAFKEFAKLHPELVSFIKNGTMTWQKFYEIYDIYGEDLSAWKDYLKVEPKEVESDIASSIQDKLKNIDINSIQEHIKTAQKALSLVSELTGKSGVSNVASEIPKVPRPINKFFED